MQGGLVSGKYPVPGVAGILPAICRRDARSPGQRYLAVWPFSRVPPDSAQAETGARLNLQKKRC
jgi:hypothetical protein